MDEPVENRPALARAMIHVGTLKPGLLYQVNLASPYIAECIREGYLVVEHVEDSPAQTEAPAKTEA